MTSTSTGPKTLVEKIWARHVITELSDGRTLLHIDRVERTWIYLDRL